MGQVGVGSAQADADGLTPFWVVFWGLLMLLALRLGWLIMWELIV
jgi:hypothetical protein